MKQTSETERAGGSVRRLIADRPIRWKLAIGFGVLLMLGILNIALYYWGAQRRDVAWQEVQRAIQRQIIVTEVMNQLDDQKKYVDVLTSVVGVQDGAAPNEAEIQQFSRNLDLIAARLLEMVRVAAPERRDALVGLHDKTERLVESWKRFYAYQWTSPSRAVEELYVTAEPLAEQLLTVDLPLAVAYEQAALEQISAEFVRTDRTFSQIAWISFLMSALMGAVIAVLVSRDVLQKISALKVGADRLGTGDLDHRIAVQGNDELGEVAASFNEMASRLKDRTDELAAQRDQIEAQRDDLRRALQHLRSTQAKLVQQEKLASLGVLTAGIAHEIKNPLNFINNFAALCEELAGELQEELGLLGERDGADGEVALILSDLRTNAAKIREHGQRADGIVRSMLLHSRGQSGEHEKADVNALLGEYLNLAYHGMRARKADFSVEVERRFDERVGELDVVPQELGRVFINLLNNAFYAVHERASVEREAYVPRVTVETKRCDGAVEIRIADNGPGIPPEERARIFEPFYTTKPTGEGTGLGLSLSYDIVTQVHGGTIEVESEPGEGASFIIVLPYRAAA